MGIVKNVMEMTWVDIQELDKEKTLLFVTIAPIEEHSHHLPVGTDIYEGEHWRKELIERLHSKSPDFNLLFLPPVPIACAGASNFYGNLLFKQNTVKRVTYELLSNIVKWKIRNIIIIASHGDPKHLIAVEEACVKINKKHGICAFSPMGAMFSAKELGIDMKGPKQIESIIREYPNDFHAGWIETSNMLDIDDSLVKSNYTDLPDTMISEKEMISPKKILEKMASYGHLGYPRIARKELGGLLNENLAQYLVEAVSAFIQRKNYEKYEHHFLYKIPFLRTNFKRNLIGIAIMLILIAAAILLR